MRTGIFCTPKPYFKVKEVGCRLKGLLPERLVLRNLCNGHCLAPTGTPSSPVPEAKIEHHGG